FRVPSRPSRPARLTHRASRTALKPPSGDAQAAMAAAWAQRPIALVRAPWYVPAARARRVLSTSWRSSMKVTRTPTVIVLLAGAAASALAAGVVDPRMTSKQPNVAFPQDIQYGAALAVDPNPAAGANPLLVGGANDLRGQGHCDINACKDATEFDSN